MAEAATIDTPPAAGPPLHDIFLSGFGSAGDRLHGPSGLVVTRFTNIVEGRQRQLKHNPGEAFVAGFTMRSHHTTLWQDGKLVRAGDLPVGTVIFSEPEQRVDSETVGAWDLLFLLLPVRLVMTVCEIAGLALSGDAALAFLNGTGKIDAKLLALGREALKEVSDPGPFSRLRADLIGQELIVQMLLRHSTMSEPIARERARQARGGLAPWQLSRAYEIMDALGEEEITLALLAGAVGCSPTHFSRAFKQSTGMPPFACLLHRRINRAKSLLADATLPIAEIALAVGFSAQPQFTTAFRRVTGTTPAAWRRARCH